MQKFFFPINIKYITRDRNIVVKKYTGVFFLENVYLCGKGGTINEIFTVKKVKAVAFYVLW